MRQIHRLPFAAAVQTGHVSLASLASLDVSLAGQVQHFITTILVINRCKSVTDGQRRSRLTRIERK